MIKMQEVEMENGEKVKMYDPKDTGLIKWQLDVMNILDNIAYAKEQGNTSFASFDIDSKKLKRLKRYGYNLVNTWEEEEFIAKNGKKYNRFIYTFEMV